MIELKPCPFCGGEAELFYHPNARNDDCRAFEAKCFSCGARIGRAVLGMGKTKEGAVSAWNARAERTCHDIGGEAPFSAVFRCSECLTMDFGGTPFYCRNCGAKVVEE